MEPGRQKTMTPTANAPTVASFFAGLGGLDLGFMWEGYQIAWANDVSPHATKTYTLNHGLVPTCQDITHIAWREIPETDVIIGGPPCQSFSLVGKRRPGDKRGQLVFSFLGAITELHPTAFVMENVPGIAASRVNSVRLPDLLVEQFSDLGYMVKKMVLTATDYLVPQRRKRLFIVGHEKRQPEVPDPAQFARECYGVDADTFDLSASSAIGDLGAPVPRGERASYGPMEPTQFARIMRANNARDVSLHEQQKISQRDQLYAEIIPPGGNYQDIPNDLATPRILKFKQSGGRTTTYGKLHPDHPAYTINTYFRRPNVGCNFHYAQSRLITPREAMRFQSIPDYIELVYSSQDNRNALIGNAVPPLLARAIAWTLKKCFTGASD